MQGSQLQPPVRELRSNMPQLKIPHAATKTLYAKTKTRRSQNIPNPPKQKECVLTPGLWLLAPRASCNFTLIHKKDKDEKTTHMGALAATPINL